MSESCRRGYKCMCFQCGEEDCEKYQRKPPEWVEKITEKLEENGVAEILRKMEKDNDNS